MNPIIRLLIFCPCAPNGASSACSSNSTRPWKAKAFSTVTLSIGAIDSSVV